VGDRNVGDREGEYWRDRGHRIGGIGSGELSS